MTTTSSPSDAQEDGAEDHAAREQADAEADAECIHHESEDGDTRDLREAADHEIGGKNPAVLLLRRSPLDHGPGRTAHQCGHEAPEDDAQDGNAEPGCAEVDEGGDTRSGEIAADDAQACGEGALFPGD